MEKQKYSARMQDEMIGEITTAHPKYLVYVGIGASWLARNTSEKILKWSQAYVKQCYRIVGVGDIFSDNETGWAWDDAAERYRPQSQNLLFVLNRKSADPCSVEVPTAEE